jgi:pyridoxamine 5'-phosphate oxidase
VDLADLDADPLRQLGQWVDEARAAGEPAPEAMCLATAGADCQPTARMVLMRGLDSGVVFYTDYGSDKASDLAANGRAAAVFHLRRPVHRQIRVTGTVERTSAEDSDRYWATRPPASRRSALASRQSSVIESRRPLEEGVAALAGTEDPARPDRWGGFRITPLRIEFWEEGPSRLHDRIRFARDSEADRWRTDRLSP